MKKRNLVVISILITLLLFTTSVTAKEITQGEFALTLAQILGLEVTSVEAAVASLTLIKIMPDKGWSVEETVTPGIVRELEIAIQKAVKAHLLEPIIAEGATVAAAAYLNLDYQTADARPDTDLEIPREDPISGPTAGGPSEMSPFRP